MPKDEQPLEITPEEWAKLKEQSGGLVHDPMEPEAEVEKTVEQPPVEPPKTYEGQAAHGGPGLFGMNPGALDWSERPLPDPFSKYPIEYEKPRYYEDRIVTMPAGGETGPKEPDLSAPSTLPKDASSDQLDPNIDTGHYDDGHAFGWSKTPQTDDLDTGHYDDGHAFGWRQAERPTGAEPPTSTGPSATPQTYEGDVKGGIGLYGPVRNGSVVGEDRPEDDPNYVPPHAREPQEPQQDLFDPSRQPPAPSSAAMDPNLDTGHYDDRHTFGWPKKTQQLEPVGPTSSALPMPLIGGGVGLLLIAGVAFFALRGGETATPVSSSAPAIASAASGATSAPTQAAVSRSCAAAPDLALKLSGGMTADVTQGCVPTVRVQGRAADDPAPACRDIVPGSGGSLVSAVDIVSFVVSGVQYDMTISAFKELPRGQGDPTLPSSFPVTPGTQPPEWATVSVRGGAGSTAKLWRKGNGTLTLASDHRSGTINAELADDADGPALRVAGSWQIVGQCRAG